MDLENLSYVMWMKIEIICIHLTQNYLPLLFIDIQKKAWTLSFLFQTHTGSIAGWKWEWVLSAWTDSTAAFPWSLLQQFGMLKVTVNISSVFMLFSVNSSLIQAISSYKADEAKFHLKENTVPEGFYPLFWLLFHLFHHICFSDTRS